MFRKGLMMLSFKQDVNSWMKAFCICPSTQTPDLRPAWHFYLFLQYVMPLHLFKSSKTHGFSMQVHYNHA